MPAGYRLVAEHVAARRTLWTIQIVAIPASLAAFALVAAVHAVGLRFGSLELVRPMTSGWLMVVGLVLAFPLHELAHGLAIRAVGALPRYGAKVVGRVMPVLYATCAEPLRRPQYAIVILAPTVALNLALAVLMACLPAIGLALFMAAAVNTAGAIGDWWIILRLLRMPSGTWVQDHPSEVGFRQLAPCAPQEG